MLVQRKLGSDPDVLGSDSPLSKAMALIRPTLDALPVKLYPNRPGTGISPEWIPDNLVSRINQLSPDIVNLHMVMMGFLRIETVSKITQPIVWTLHDMWVFTGGCYYAGECERFTDSCGACPQLGSSRPYDLTRWIWNRKQNAWKDPRLTIVCPSRWLAAAASRSALLKNSRIETIPYGIDTQAFHPVPREGAREILGLPQDKSLVLFGSINTSDPRKGHHLLTEAMQKLKDAGSLKNIELVSFGISPKSSLDDLGVRVHRLGKLSDQVSLKLAYSAANVFVAPSLQDNLPNTVMESLACGTPCVAFDIGGMGDMIAHEKKGYLAKALDIEDLAHGIEWVLGDSARWRVLKENARQKAVLDYSLNIQAQRYLSLYDELLSTSAR